MVGTIASAAPGGVHGKPTPSPSWPSRTRRSPPRPRPPNPPRPRPPRPKRRPDQTGTAPDFSGCVGLTGLDNAICRHEALLQVKPHNPGLANSLGHLQANAAAHAAKAVGTHGNSGTHRNSGSHGPSGAFGSRTAVARWGSRAGTRLHIPRPPPASNATSAPRTRHCGVSAFDKFPEGPGVSCRIRLTESVRSANRAREGSPRPRPHRSTRHPPDP